ncbi:hypothetical protein [Polaromonas sp. SM01]|uniref:hypothetical protein n=1 Tax=Polaromonas sp. SM01 TaxID=3085630 RepID=UPI002981123E|nr:hypothetical protein [Polaromonas sp. SM01]MDW5441797.1 hypothetical protein [Polaromonas sp. SM01]
MSSFSSAVVGAAALLSLLACSSGPKPADWQMETKSSMERAVAAYMEGNTRVEALEAGRALSEVSSTGRIDLTARVELLRCASRVASLVFEPCAGFERLRQDAPAAERAYADYLAGRLPPQDIALLPAPQRAAAAGDVAGVKSISDPLSQLVAAAVLFQSGRASPALLQAAVDTASAQGWRRPLLAWLGVQAQLADKGGDAEEAARLRRRIALVQTPAAGATGSTP